MGEGSGGEGGGKWGERGREVGGKGEGTGNGVPPCPPPLISVYSHTETFMGCCLFGDKTYTGPLADSHEIEGFL